MTAEIIIKHALQHIIENNTINVVVDNKYNYEFKFIRLAQEGLILFGGDGITMKWFDATTDVDDIFIEIKKFFKGIDIDICASDVEVW